MQTANRALGMPRPCEHVRPRQSVCSLPVQTHRQRNKVHDVAGSEVENPHHLIWNKPAKMNQYALFDAGNAPCIQRHGGAEK